MTRLPQQLARILALSALAIGVVLFVPRPVPAGRPPGLFPWEFQDAAPQGFGDRQNNGAWSMQWWRGKLYVGTVRSWFCWSQAWFHDLSPIAPYPPRDPDMDCTSDPRNLPLQAEIWRYTPATGSLVPGAGSWERVYQSPKDVEIPSSPGWFTTRDVGYRDMVVFEEPDGTEALYACGATVNALWPPMPPPRILRSTDGTTFEPIPQEPGTILGDLGQDQATFRDMEVLEGRLYVINGKIQGHGGVLEAENPAGGNDNFRWITPQDMRVFEMAPYNGFLYLGLVDRLNGFGVVKTKPTGQLPYIFTPVVTNGGLRQPVTSPSVVSMHVFDGRLYVGTDQPTEVIRINPDDSWDLVVGTPRETPDGWKYPLSGLDAGFDWPLNAHMWRMQAHDGTLYVGTNDSSLRWGKAIPSLEETLSWQYGFDLYQTSDGVYFSPITVDGFGDRFQNGIRAMASTPEGLFAGSVSFWYGLRIWQGAPDELAHFTYLPLLMRSNGNVAPVQVVAAPPRMDAAIGQGQALPLSRWPRPPQRLEVESVGAERVLSWEAGASHVRFRIFRADMTSNRRLRIPEIDPDAWVPEPFAEIGATERAYFVDATVSDGSPALYYVIAEDGAGGTSPPSNLARAPSLAPPATFARLEASLARWSAGEQTLSRVDRCGVQDVAALDCTLEGLEQLRRSLQDGRSGRLAPWQTQEIELLLDRLVRRVRLAQDGLVPPSDLDH